MRSAEHPFQFVTASYLTRITACKATNLLELRDVLENCTDASVFYHTFQSLSRHHFLTEGFSSDFAQWVMAACNRHQLAEKLASIDLRDYVSLADLRGDLRRAVAEYCEANPQAAEQAAFEPFYALESIELTAPLGLEAWTLEQFRSGLNCISNAAFHFHFISSRLRLQLQTNDFSHWFDTGLGLRELAQHTNRIDIYTNTLDSARAILLSLVDKELNR